MIKILTRLIRDTRGDKIQAFVFRTAIMSGTTYAPEHDVLVHIGADVSITINGVAVPYLSGDKIVLLSGVSYVFSVSIPLGLS